METLNVKQPKAIKPIKRQMRGSLINRMMGNNDSIPVVGKGATITHYSDRTCAEVIEVSNDGKTIIIEDYSAKANPNIKTDIGHQNWVLELNGNRSTVVYRNGGWYTKSTIVEFTKEFIANAPRYALATCLTPEQKEIIYKDNSVRPIGIIEGITRYKKTYTKINILFGVLDYYYDWSI